MEAKPPLSRKLSSAPFPVPLGCSLPPQAQHHRGSQDAPKEATTGANGYWGRH